MIDVMQEVREIAQELIGIRQAIHRHPELGNQEYETADRVEAYLADCGIETRRLLDTAVIGTLRGGFAGRTVAFRADLDALPLNEATGAPFASGIPGRMHACGHDVHTAALLGAAKVLAKHRETLPGMVVFLFQPDEEGNGGAARMIREGCLEGVEAVFGCHVNPELPEGHAGIRYDKFYAASDMFGVTLTGRSAHGAEREKGIDALAAAAELTTSLLALPRQVTQDRCVLTVGRLCSGTAGNILPGTAELEGILRTLGPETRAAMKARFYETVHAVAERTGTTAEIHFRESYPGVVNEPAMTALAERAAIRLLGAEAVCRIAEPTMTTEDFGYFLGEVPGSFYHVGAGCSLPLHNDRFLPTEEALLTAAALHVAVAEAFLRQEPEQDEETQ